MQQIMVGYVDQCKTTMPIPGVWLGKVSRVPYSGKFSLVQIFAEMRPYPSEEIFAVFIFTERKRDALTTPLPDDGHAPLYTCNRRNDTERRSEASLCNNGLLFLLCRVLSNYENIKTACRHGLKTGLLKRRFSTADLDFDNFRASLTGSLVLYTWVNKHIRLFQKVQGNMRLIRGQKLTTPPKPRRLFGSTCT